MEFYKNSSQCKDTLVVTEKIEVLLQLATNGFLMPSEHSTEFLCLSVIHKCGLMSTQRKTTLQVPI
jgi:hypothetical protein